jgi:hypothetical protein
VNDDKDSRETVHSDRDPTLFRVSVVANRDRPLIFERGYSIRKPDAVLSEDCLDQTTRKRITLCRP